MITKIDNNELAVIWSSSDPDVAHSTVFMYTLNAKCREWWNVVHLVIWGPSAKLLAEDVSIQLKMKDMIQAGVNVTACRENADIYNVADDLADLGINVKYMGEPVTEMLKSGAKIITF
ncbi:MAG: DsrE family protein [Denitrovibrio sp.]|nr:MAG: DsrE family protein [Denitrovibrio sp.]